MSNDKKVRDMIIASLVPLFFSALFFGIVYSDSKLYIHMTRFFLGIADINGISGWVATRPLIPLLATIPSIFLWVPAAYGILNSVFWVLSTILIYQITCKILGSRRPALAAALFFASSPPTLLYFGSVMLEAGSTFFGLLILWTFLFLEEKINNFRSVIGAILVGIGVLSKETTLPIIITTVLIGIITRRIKKQFFWFILLILPSILWQVYTSMSFGENYWTHYVRAGLEYSEKRYGVSFYADVVDVAKALALSYFPVATVALILGFFSLSERKQNLIFYCMILPAIISYFLWPFRDLRIGVVTYYALAPLAGAGLEFMVKSLEKKPLFDKINPEIVRTSLLVIHIFTSTYYVYSRLGRFSPPWDIYLFAPSSLKAGLVE